MESNKLTNLNPGIKKTVELLQSLQYTTVDSGDGRTHDFKCDLEIPYIHIIVYDEEQLVEWASRLYLLLRWDYNVDFSKPFSETGDLIGPHLTCNYTPADKLATISLYNVDDKLLGLQ